MNAVEYLKWLRYHQGRFPSVTDRLTPELQEAIFKLLRETSVHDAIAATEQLFSIGKNPFYHELGATIRDLAQLFADKRAAAAKRRREREQRERELTAQEEFRDRWLPVWEGLSEEEREPIRQAVLADEWLHRRYSRRPEDWIVQMSFLDELSRVLRA